MATEIFPIPVLDVERAVEAVQASIKELNEYKGKNQQYGGAKCRL